MNNDILLDDLITLSRELGRPERELAILGEGNTSVDIGDGTFWVKASGGRLAASDSGSFSRVRAAAIMALLDAASLSDEQVDIGLRGALADAG